MSVDGSVIFCDDIRFEGNGKSILIGVYADGLQAAFLPQTLPLSFWVKLKNIRAGDWDIKIAVGVNGDAQHSLDANLAIQDPASPINLYFTFPMRVDKPGHVFIEISGFEGGVVFREEMKVLSAPGAEPQPN